MLTYALCEALFMLQQYELQKHIKVTDDDVVIAYLRSYGNKKNVKNDVEYKTNIEKYAYLLGKQHNYTEEGVNEEDIVSLVHNDPSERKPLHLQE